MDSRDNSISVRMILLTLTYACFYKLYVLFLDGSSTRVFSKEMFTKFNEISALIMTSRYILDYGATGIHSNYVFSSRYNTQVH